MNYWYLASPYTHISSIVREQRYQVALAACAAFTKMGECVYSPIVHWHHVAALYDLPHDWNYWHKADTYLAEAMYGIQVLMMQGWDTSTGVTEEIKLFHKAHKPIVYVKPALLLKKANLTVDVNPGII